MEESKGEPQYPTARQFLTIGFGKYDSYYKSGELPDLGIVDEESKKLLALFNEYKFTEVELFPKQAIMHSNRKCLMDKITTFL